jgi:prepilin-type N-terminal cleavage/methylation domain-containing protein
MKTIFGNSRGITLVELLVVVSIIAILAMALEFSYQGWMGRYEVESEVKQIVSDLVYARATAMQENRDYFVEFPDTTSYTMYRDTNPATEGNGLLEDTGANLDAVVTGYPKKVTFPLTWGGGYITFDRRGGISGGSISVPPAPPTTDSIRINTTEDADLDCILLSDTSISQGKWGDCDSNSGTPDDCCAK